MIRIEALQLQRLAAGILQQLNVADTVRLLETRELSDGSWLVTFEDGLPFTRFPAFEITIEPGWSLEDAGRELRQALRQKLWICPLCQRRAEIRRVVDTEAFRVVCERCGRYEISTDLLDSLRTGTEEGDAAVLGRLSRLSGHAGRGGRLPPLSLDNWTDVADSVSQDS